MPEETSSYDDIYALVPIEITARELGRTVAATYRRRSRLGIATGKNSRPLPRGPRLYDPTLAADAKTRATNDA